jgi:transcriptional regulator with XRE-family HTH domain
MIPLTLRVSGLLCPAHNSELKRLFRFGQEYKPSIRALLFRTKLNLGCMPEICKIFAENLRSLRKELKLTQEQLAELADVSAVSIHHYENQTVWPNPKTIEDLAKALKVEDYKLFQKRDPPAVDALAKVILEQEIELKALRSIPLEIWDALLKATPRKIEQVKAILGLPVLVSTRRLEKKG